MTQDAETTESPVCEIVKNAIRDELCLELSFIRPEMAECIAASVCNKVGIILEEKMAVPSIEQVEDDFREASKKLGW